MGLELCPFSCRTTWSAGRRGTPSRCRVDVHVLAPLVYVCLKARRLDQINALGATNHAVACPDSVRFTSATSGANRDARHDRYLHPAFPRRTRSLSSDRFTVELHVQLCYYTTYGCTCNSRGGVVQALAAAACGMDRFLACSRSIVKELDAELQGTMGYLFPHTTCSFNSVLLAMVGCRCTSWQTQAP